MEMAMYLAPAVLVEGQSVRKVAQDHGMSKTWLYELVARYRAEGRLASSPARGGLTALRARSNHPQTCGKVERFHQTMKKHLEATKAARSMVPSRAASTTSSSTTTRCACTARSASDLPERPLAHRGGPPALAQGQVRRNS